MNGKNAASPLERPIS